MYKWITVVIAVMAVNCFAETVPEPVIEGPKAPSRQPSEMVGSKAAILDLSQDEIAYIKRNFRTAVINDCLNVLIVIENDKNSGALTRITHPLANPVAALVMLKVWKDSDDFEKDLFNTVYKESDVRNKTRVWDIQNEIAFMRARIEARIKDDPKLCDDILTALKAVEKK